MAESTLTIRNGRLIRNGVAQADSVVCVRGRVVTYAGPPGGAPPPSGRAIDAGGRYVCPGFIDLHVHGAAGCDFLSADPAGVRNIAAAHARRGSTALFATVRSAAPEEMRRAVSLLGQLIRSGGAPGVVGIHLEGPFINPARAGVHPLRWLRAPDLAALDALLEGAEGCPLIVTLAPELPGAMRLVEAVAARGAVPAAGHSDATFDEACAAFSGGVCLVTHLFNAMSGMHHRRPGLAAAALADGRVAAELVADGVHVHPEMAKMAFRQKGGDGIVLVTDSMQALDAEAEIFSIDGEVFSVRNGAPVRDDGTLCGSVLTMGGALRNAARWTGKRPEEIAALATTVPARLAGLADRKGALLPGMDADIAIFDERFDVQAAFVGGALVYAAAGFEAAH